MRPDIATGLAPMRWGTGYMLGSRRFGPFGRDTSAAFGHTGLTNVAMWAGPFSAARSAWSAAESPAVTPEATRYTELLDRISAEIPRTRSEELCAHRAGLAS